MLLILWNGLPNLLHHAADLYPQNEAASAMYEDELVQARQSIEAGQCCTAGACVHVNSWRKIWQSVWMNLLALELLWVPMKMASVLSVSGDSRSTERLRQWLLSPELLSSLIAKSTRSLNRSTTSFTAEFVVSLPPSQTKRSVQTVLNILRHKSIIISNSNILLLLSTCPIYICSYGHSIHAALTVPLVSTVALLMPLLYGIQ